MPALSPTLRSPVACAGVSQNIGYREAERVMVRRHWRNALQVLSEIRSITDDREKIGFVAR